MFDFVTNKIYMFFKNERLDGFIHIYNHTHK